MSKSYEERMAEKYNFLKKESEKQDVDQNIEKKPTTNDLSLIHI